MVAVVLLGLGYFGYQKIFGSTSTITVNGNGKVMVKAARASFIVSRVSVSADISAAIDDNETSVNRLITVAKRLGGSSAEISKSVYQVTAQGGQYLVANAISVKTPNFSSVNDMVKQFYKEGATSVTNISYLPEDEAATEQEARKDAVAKAHSNAVAIAKSVGKSVGRVVSIADDQAGASSTVSNALVDAQSQIVVNKTVTVAYEIR